MYSYTRSTDWLTNCQQRNRKENEKQSLCFVLNSFTHPFKKEITWSSLPSLTSCKIPLLRNLLTIWFLPTFSPFSPFSLSIFLPHTLLLQLLLTLDFNRKRKERFIWKYNHHLKTFLMQQKNISSSFFLSLGQRWWNQTKLLTERYRDTDQLCLNDSGLLQNWW